MSSIPQIFDKEESHIQFFLRKQDNNDPRYHASYEKITFRSFITDYNESFNTQFVDLFHPNSPFINVKNLKSFLRSVSFNFDVLAENTTKQKENEEKLGNIIQHIHSPFGNQANNPVGNTAFPPFGLKFAGLLYPSIWTDGYVGYISKFDVKADLEKGYRSGHNSDGNYFLMAVAYKVSVTFDVYGEGIESFHTSQKPQLPVQPRDKLMPADPLDSRYLDRGPSPGSYEIEEGEVSEFDTTDREEIRDPNGISVAFTYLRKDNVLATILKSQINYVFSKQITRQEKAKQIHELLKEKKWLKDRSIVAPGSSLFNPPIITPQEQARAKAELEAIKARQGAPGEEPSVGQAITVPKR